MAKKAFLTGIGGQDGSYLCEYLLSLGYEVHGIIRRNSISEHQESRIKGLNIQTYYGDVLDAGGLGKLLKKIQPNEIYNLAAQSHVRISFDIPQFTIQVNALGALNVLEAYKEYCPDAKYYQASSSEMFGNSVDSDGYQREATPMHPVSPYGCAKLFAYNATKMYREAHGLHACSGILFNHESPRRASNFVTTKIIKGAIDIHWKRAEKLYLGNLDSCRDWGHSKDYVRAMHAIVNHAVPADWVVATGQTHSIRELCDLVFKKFDMNYEDYVVQDEKYMRPQELNYLRGDSSQIREVLKWEPQYTFDMLVHEMVQAWL